MTRAALFLGAMVMACAVMQPAAPTTPCVPVASARRCVDYLRARGELNFDDEHWSSVARALGASAEVSTGELVRLAARGGEHRRLATDTLLLRGAIACAELQLADEATAWEGLVLIVGRAPARDCAEAALRRLERGVYARDWLSMALRGSQNVNERAVVWLLRTQWMRDTVASELERQIGSRSAIRLPCRGHRVPGCKRDLVGLIQFCRLVGLDDRLRALLGQVASSAEFGENRLFALLALSYSSGGDSSGLGVWRDLSPQVAADMPWLGNAIDALSNELALALGSGENFDRRVGQEAARMGGLVAGVDSVLWPAALLPARPFPVDLCPGPAPFPPTK